MKLSLAVALLGQTVPLTFSKKYGPAMARDGAVRLIGAEILKAASPESLLGHGKNERQGLHSNRRFMRQVAKTLKNGPQNLKTIVPCDPKGTDADVGILSCGMDYICEPSSTSPLGGFCTSKDVNIPDHGKAIMQCDPTLIDIGILACREGQFCQHDGASGLGGYCVDGATTNNNRHLEPNYRYLDQMLYNCEPWPAANPFGICDCSDVNLTTGTGTMYCSQNITASFFQGCDEYVVYDIFTYTFNNSRFVKSHDCYETTVPVVEKFCLTHYYSTAEPLCRAEWNDKLCTSCVTKNDMPGVQLFDCSNVDGPVGDSVSDALASLELCANSTCTSLCGEGSFLNDSKTDIFTFQRGTWSCGYLAFQAENSAISDSYCQLYIDATQYGGCCELPNSTSTEGNSPSLPGSGAKDNSSTIPVENDGENDTSSVPGAETDNNGQSAGHIIATMALVACQSAAAMFLLSQV